MSKKQPTNPDPNKGGGRGTPSEAEKQRRGLGQDPTKKAAQPKSDPGQGKRGGGGQP